MQTEKKLIKDKQLINLKEKYRIVTETGKEIMKSESYEGCESYWNSCNGIYEDENGEHHIYIEEIKYKAKNEIDTIDALGIKQNPNIKDSVLNKLHSNQEKFKDNTPKGEERVVKREELQK